MRKNMIENVVSVWLNEGGMQVIKKVGLEPNKGIFSKSQGLLQVPKIIIIFFSKSWCHLYETFHKVTVTIICMKYFQHFGIEYILSLHPKVRVLHKCF